MRLALAIFWCLVLLSLLTSNLGASGEPDLGTKPPFWPSTVQGFGLNQESARQDALRETLRVVTEFIHGLQPPLVEWTPTEPWIQDNLLQGRGYAGGDFQVAGSPDSKTWILTLKRPDLGEFARLDRQAFLKRRQQERNIVAQERTARAGQALIGLLVVLAAVFCYHRSQASKAHFMRTS